MTGADWPGNSAVHSGFFGSIALGKPFSADVPFWFGPRQASQPFTGAAAGAALAACCVSEDAQSKARRVGVSSFMA